MEYTILAKYQGWSLNKEQTHNNAKIKMDESQQVTLYKALSKNRFYSIFFWYIFSCTSPLRDYLVGVGSGVPFPPEVDVCSVLVLKLLIGSP